MEFRGTKGSWSCMVDENYSDMYQVICKPNSSTFGEQEYNAQLIATAPELLEMLIEIKDQIENGRTYVTKEDIEKLIEKATKTEKQ